MFRCVVIVKFFLKVLYKKKWQVRYCFLCLRAARIDKNLYEYACWDLKGRAFLAEYGLGV